MSKTFEVTLIDKLGRRVNQWFATPLPAEILDHCYYRNAIVIYRRRLALIKGKFPGELLRVIYVEVGLKK